MTTTSERLHPFDAARAAGREPYKVRDLAEAELGRKEIRLAEQEMPGLMSVREQYGSEKAAGWRESHGKPPHDHPDCRSDRDASALGADVRWVSCNIFSTQDHAAAAVVVGRPEDGGTVEDPRGVPVFAWKGERWRNTGGARTRHRVAGR